MATDCVGRTVAAKCAALEREFDVYKLLCSSTAVPDAQWVTNADGTGSIRLEIHGRSLEELLNLYGKFSLKTVLLLADQLISQIECIHRKSFLHRDIKPGNFVLGFGQDELKVIGLGRAKKYENTNQHLSCSRSSDPMYNAQYASISTHKGEEQFCCDDLESIGYLILHLYLGKLPWETTKGNIEMDPDELIKKKLNCWYLNYGFPKEFNYFIEYTRALFYDQEPDYKFLRGLLGKLFIKNGFKTDNVFEWTGEERTGCASSISVHRFVAPQKPSLDTDTNFERPLTTLWTG